MNNTSAMYWLSTTPTGMEVLKILFLGNSKLVKSISAKELCLLRTEGKDANTSVLYLLITSARGCALLKYLFTVNPDIAQSIRVNDLCVKRTVIKDGFSSSVLDGLSKSSEGQEILDIMCDNNAQLDIFINKIRHQLCPSKTGMFSKYASTPCNGLAETNNSSICLSDTP